MARIALAAVALAVPAVLVAQVPAVLPPPKSADEVWGYLAALVVAPLWLQLVAPWVAKRKDEKACMFAETHPPKLDAVHASHFYTDAEGNVMRVMSGERRRQEDEVTKRTIDLLSQLSVDLREGRAEQMKLADLLVRLEPALTESLRVSNLLAHKFLAADAANEATIRMLDGDGRKL